MQGGSLPRSRTFILLASALLLGAGRTGADSFEDRLNALTTQLNSGRYGPMEADARTLLAELEAAGNGDTIDAARVLKLLSEAMWRSGKAADPETRMHAERAVALFEQREGPDHIDVAGGLNTLGAALALAGDYSG